MHQGISFWHQMYASVLILLACCQAGITNATSTEIADLILTNGKIYTLNRETPWADAMAIKNGDILAIGDREQILMFAGKNTRVENMEQQFLMPGINDAHVHTAWGGSKQLYECNFPFSAAPEEIADTVRSCIDASPDAEWIVGGQWASEFFDRFELPVSPRKWLDQVSTEHAIVLADDSFHNSWVNSRALEKLGIDETTVAPEGGTIMKDKNGAVNGVLLESGAFQIEQYLPARTEEEFELAAAEGILELNRVGITGFKDAMASKSMIRAYRSLDQQGKLNSRVISCYPLPGQQRSEPLDLAPVIAEVKSLNSENLSNNCVKYFLDGVPTAARTAAMLAPYIPAEDGKSKSDSGKLLQDPLVLAAEVTALDKMGITVKIHAAGDRAIRVGLDVIEAARKANGPAGPRHELAHAELIDTRDLPRFSELNVLADMSPFIWFPSPIIDSLTSAIGSRSNNLFPFRSLLDAGALVAAGSDWPAAVPTPSPWPGIEAAVTRSNPLGSSPEKLGPHESISLAEALEIYTLNGAKALGIDDITGSLEAGKSADFIVLDRNLMESPVEAISDTRVLETWVKGIRVN